MKILATLLIVALVLAVVVVSALYLVLRKINEETSKRCGNCVAFDRDLRICWYDRTTRDEYGKGCMHHNHTENTDDHEALP